MKKALSHNKSTCIDVNNPFYPILIHSHKSFHDLSTIHKSKKINDPYLLSLMDIVIDEFADGVCEMSMKL